MPIPLGTGVTQYGSVVFPSDTETMAFTIRPVLDRAGRTIKHNVVSVTLKFRVLGVTTDAQVAVLVDQLTKPAQGFTYTGMGFGTWLVNAGAQKDYLWGPIPKLVSLRHMAGANATEVVWSVDMALLLCGDAVFEGQPMEFGYRLTVNRDRSGYSTRTYSGYLTIPLTRQSASSRQLTTSADEWLEKIVPALLPGFRRIIGATELDEAKTTITWSITDEEVGPNYLPEGIVDGTMRVSLRSKTEKPGLGQWSLNFSGEFETARDYPPETGFAQAAKIVKGRVDAIRAGVLLDFITNPNPRAPDIGRIDEFKQSLNVIPIDMALEEPNVFGKQVTGYSFTFMLTVPLENVVKASKLWRPIDTSWDRWALSLRGSAFNPRGNAKLKFNPQDDVIVDLCLGRSQMPQLRTAPQFAPSLHTIAQMFSGPCPSAQDSWLAYENRLVFEDDQNTVMHIPLPTTALQLLPVNVGSAGFSIAQYQVQPEAKIQTRCAPGLYVWMIGKALRVCYSIPPPELRYIQNVEVTPANRKDCGEGFQTWPWSTLGHTVYAATWRLRYMLPKAPTGQLIGLSTPLFPGGASLSTRGALQTGSFSTRG